MPEQEYETVRAEVADRILTVTLNRPEKLNAFNPRMMADLLDVLDAADADDDVRVIVVTGAGRGFCAGADLGSGGSTFDQPQGGRAGTGTPDGGGSSAADLLQHQAGDRGDQRPGRRASASRMTLPDGHPAGVDVARSSASSSPAAASCRRPPRAGSCRGPSACSGPWSG